MVDLVFYDITPAVLRGGVTVGLVVKKTTKVLPDQLNDVLFILAGDLQASPQAD